MTFNLLVLGDTQTGKTSFIRAVNDLQPTFPRSPKKFHKFGKRIYQIG